MSFRSSAKRFRPVIERCESRNLLAPGWPSRMRQPASHSEATLRRKSPGPIN